MPSTAHELFVHAVRESPSLVLALIASAGAIELAGTSVTLADAGLPDLVSALTADALVLLRRADGGKIAAVVEVQFEVDEDKVFTWPAWPAYHATARRRHRCPTFVVVLCPSERVAAWARRPIALSPAHCVRVPLAFGPSALASLDTEGASAELKWLVAYALAADAERGPRAYTVVNDALADLSDLEIAALYSKILTQALSPAVRAHIEAMMMEPKNEALASEPIDPLVQHMLDLRRARREAREALAVGREQGREQGREDGLHEGLRKGREDALLLLLQARGLPVSEAEQRRISAERDLAVLDSWLRASVDAASVAEVLERT